MLDREIHEAMLPVGSMMLSFHTVPELARLQQAVKEDIAAYHQNTGVNILDPGHHLYRPPGDHRAGTVVLPGTISGAVRSSGRTARSAQRRGPGLPGGDAPWSTPPRSMRAAWAGRPCGALRPHPPGVRPWRRL